MSKNICLKNKKILKTAFSIGLESQYHKKNALELLELYKALLNIMYAIFNTLTKAFSQNDLMYFTRKLTPKL